MHAIKIQSKAGRKMSAKKSLLLVCHGFDCTKKMKILSMVVRLLAAHGLALKLLNN